MGITKESVASVLRDPPEELFCAITADDFARQYEDFLSWVHSFLEHPFGFEFMPVTAYCLRRLDDSGLAAGEVFDVSPHDVVESCRWQRYAPKRPLKVTSRTHGLCMYMSAQRDVDLRKVYAYVQSTPLAEIRAMRLWNIVLAYQFGVHNSVATESLAETVGSFLHNLEQKTHHHSLSDANLSLRTSLKAAGLRGLGERRPF